MGNRAGRKLRFNRWCIFTARNQIQAQAFKHILRDVVADCGRRVKIIFRDKSLYRVDLVWPTPVMYDSAAKLISLAKEETKQF